MAAVTYEAKFAQLSNDYDSACKKLSEFAKTVAIHKEGGPILFLDDTRTNMRKEVEKCSKAWKELNKMVPALQRWGNTSHNRLWLRVYSLETRFERLDKCFTKTPGELQQEEQRFALYASIAGIVAAVAIAFVLTH